VAGAIDMEDYLAIIAEAGFTNITIQKQKEIKLPDEILEKYMSEDEIVNFTDSQTGIFSITVYGEKPE
jgi:hypothetical protein